MDIRVGKSDKKDNPIKISILEKYFIFIQFLKIS